MSKVTCPNCGHKNSSATMICSECGNYLGDSGAGTEERISTPEPAAVKEPKSEVVEDDPRPSVSGETIPINTRGTLYRFFPIIVYGVILIAYVAMVNLFSLSVYYFFPLLAVLFVTPQIARKVFFPVKFNNTGFNISHNGNSHEFLYVDISNALVKLPDRGIQTVTLSMDKTGSSVTLDFDQMMSLRQFLSQLNRRRIPIKVENGIPR